MFKIFSPAKTILSLKTLRGFSTAGNLYTWGKIPSGTGFSEFSNDPILRTPRKLGQFPSNVSKVAMGPWHSAIITSEGQLFTCGYGKKGSLGHENTQDLGAPELVDFFKGKKVKDVVCDGTYTLALTEDGSLWRWGTMKLGLWGYIVPREDDVESLIETNATPQRIEGFEDLKIIALTAGTNFVSVFTENGVFNWGRGDYGSFGNGYGGFFKAPVENTELTEFLEHNHLKVVQAKSSGYSTVLLLSNGKLYGMGDNWYGQLGIRKNVGIIMDEYVNQPTPVVEENLKGRKIVDFDLGGNTLLILTDDNKVFFSGMRLICKPTLWSLPENVKVKKLLASYETFAVVTSENKVIAFNENLIANSEIDNYSGIYEVPEEVFGKGEILEIGGRYQTHYAIVKN